MSTPISALPAAGPLNGTELFACVQSGTTKKTLLALIPDPLTLSDAHGHSSITSNLRVVGTGCDVTLHFVGGSATMTVAVLIPSLFITNFYADTTASGFIAPAGASGVINWSAAMIQWQTGFLLTTSDPFTDVQVATGGGESGGWYKVTARVVWIGPITPGAELQIWMSPVGGTFPNGSQQIISTLIAPSLGPGNQVSQEYTCTIEMGPGDAVQFGIQNGDVLDIALVAQWWIEQIGPASP